MARNGLYTHLLHADPMRESDRSPLGGVDPGGEFGAVEFAKSEPYERAHSCCGETPARRERGRP